MATAEERAIGALQKTRLAGIVRQLKKRGDWPPSGGMAELGRLVVDVGTKKKSSTTISRWLVSMGEDVSWAKDYRGDAAEAAKPFKDKLKKLIDSGDYPKNLDELVDKIGGSSTSAVSRWLKEFDISTEDWSWSPSKNWNDAEWGKWQDSKREELASDSKFSKMFETASKDLQERYLTSVDNRDALKGEGDRVSEYSKAREAIDAGFRYQSSPSTGSGSGSFKSPEQIQDFDSWDELLQEAKGKASNLFTQFISRGRGRSFNLLRNPREANYVYNLFLREQIDHLANKTPLKQISHGFASKGEKSSGLNNALQIFAENWYPNIKRKSKDVVESDPAWSLWKDAEKRYNVYSEHPDIPIVDSRQVQGYLKLPEKYSNETIPWLELEPKRLSNLMSSTFSKLMEDSQNLNPEKYAGKFSLIKPDDTPETLQYLSRYGKDQLDYEKKKRETGFKAPWVKMMPPGYFGGGGKR